MKLTLDRRYKLATYTIGKLYVDGKYFCDTLEDTDRGLTSDMPLSLIKTKKIYGETAIPRGKYAITLNVQSPKFSKVSSYKFCNGYLPRLVNVPAYEGVLIHIGNRPTDTFGCILVGKNTKKGQVLESTATFKALYKELKRAKDNNESITIEII